MEITTRSDFPKLLDHLGLPRIIAEIGTAEGIFSTEIFNWGVEKLYLIDIWEHVPFIDGCGSFSQEWHDKNYNEVVEKFGDKSNVVILKGFSYKVAKEIPDNSLSLGIIDADHTYQGCKADIQVYWPKITNGGILYFHDFKNVSYGVNRAVQEFTGNNGIHVLEENGDIANMGAYIRKL